MGDTDYRAVRGVVESILTRLDADRPVRVTPTDRPGYARGACGQVFWGDSAVGYLGKVDRAIADQLSLRELPIVAELELQPLLGGAEHVPS